MTVPFVQARNYTPTGGRAIDLIVLHDMEAAQSVNTAERVADWFAGSTAPKASAHRCFDKDSQVQCVRDQDVAWHAPGASHNGLGYEHAGYARQTREQWLEADNLAMLEISAAQAAEDCATYNLPIAYVDAAGLLRGERGITTHQQVSIAFKRSTHWDPGFEFPIDIYLEMVTRHSNGGTPVTYVAPAPAPTKAATGPRTLRVGSVGPDVKVLQNILTNAGCYAGRLDGIFGSVTKTGVECWQRKLHIEVDGVCGPATHEATAQFFQWLVAQAAQPAPPPAPPWPGRQLKYPPVMRGDDVRAYQDKLAARGWTIAVDGAFGSGSRGVTIAFQNDKHLEPDGIVGRITWDAAMTSPVT